jgi:uncharacterized membrane protein (DUF106 family)
MEEFEKLLFKRFNDEIREMQAKHKLQIESLKDKQAKLYDDLRELCEGSPKLIDSLCKAIKA